MDFQPKSHEKIRQLIQRGVEMTNPGTVDIGDEVNINRISGKDVRIYPGCRIYGSKTVISSGCQLGYEAPVTIEDCQLASDVQLKGGFCSNSVFLNKSKMGTGAHVREGCLLEEEASGAHAVGLKQTILFPFVTLGSLMNFCDCFMAGGTSRSNHSEVGSSYIHFNFTPDADKATPSLLGDVPKGVMVNQPPIFLGGQGGIIGPVHMGYGNIVAAGSMIRHDYPQNNQLIFEFPHASGTRDFIPAAYSNFRRIVKNNILYLANLKALESWYLNIRKPFFEIQEFGSFIYEGAMDKLSLAGEERLKRLKAMAQNAATRVPNDLRPEAMQERKEFHKKMGDIETLFSEEIHSKAISSDKDEFLRNLEQHTPDYRQYIETIQKLPPDTSAKGVQWLQGIIDYYCQRISTMIASIKLFEIHVL